MSSSSASVHVPHSRSEPQLPSFTPPVRPKFNSHKTDDRLREGSGRLPSFSMVNNISKNRKSVFRETGLLEGSESSGTAYTEQRSFGKKHDLDGFARLTADSPSDGPRRAGYAGSRGSSSHGEGEASSPSEKQPWYSRLTPGRRPRIQTVATAPSNMSGLSRLTMIALLIAVVLPGFSYNNGRKTVDLSGAKAGVIKTPRSGSGPVLEIRANSPTDVCTRWSHQGEECFDGLRWTDGERTSG